MTQMPSMQAPEEEFRQQLAALEPGALGDFILNVFFDAVGALESEGAAWAHTHNAGQGDAEYLLRMETDFQAKLATFERNSEILLQEAEQRARDYVFQIKWWEQRLADVRHNSDERLSAVQSRAPTPAPAAAEPIEPPPSTAPPDSQPDTQPITLESPPQPPPAPTSAPQGPPSLGGALDQLRTELELGMSPGQPPPSTQPGPPRTMADLQAEVEAARQGISAAGEAGVQRPPAPQDQIEELQGQVETELQRVQDLERQLAAAADIRSQLDEARAEVASLRQEAAKAEALGAQLEALRVQMESERLLSAGTGEHSAELARMINDNESLRAQLAAGAPPEALPDLENQAETAALRERVDESKARAAQLANELREPLALLVAQLPVVSENEHWALRERENLLEHLLEQLMRFKEDFFAPARQAVREGIERLRASGVDTRVYEEILEVGSVGVALMLERLLEARLRERDTPTR